MFLLFLKGDLMKYVCIFMIKAYQLLLSPYLGRSCRFYPSCSHYGLQAFEKWGFFKGFKLTMIRLLKCHPWHEGGHDPVP